GAALLAAMVSLPLAFAAGIGFGVIQSVITFNEQAAANVEVVMFGLLLFALIVRARGLQVGPRDEERSSWRFAGDAASANPDPIRRRVGWAGAAAALAMAVVLPM